MSTWYRALVVVNVQYDLQVEKKIRIFTGNRQSDLWVI